MDKTEDTHKREEVSNLMALMEEMAGAPKEEMGKRQPGERGAYESKRSSLPAPTILKFSKAERFDG